MIATLLPQRSTISQGYIQIEKTPCNFGNAACRHSQNAGKVSGHQFCDTSCNEENRKAYNKIRILEHHSYFPLFAFSIQFERERERERITKQKDITTDIISNCCFI
jgi:hypothetical protein